MKKRAATSRYAWTPTGVDNIYRRAEKFYFVKMTEGRRQFTPLADPDGRPSRDLPDAIRAAARLVANPFVGHAAPITATLEKFFASKMARGEWEETTRHGHRHIYAAYALALPKPITAVTSADLQAWYDSQLARGITENSALTYFACIASLFRWAFAERLIPHNPALDVVTKKPATAPEGKFCNYDERDRLIETATDPRLKLFLILGFHFGLRRREIDHARDEWLDLRQRVLRVTNLLEPRAPFAYFRIKNGCERRIPMSNTATRILGEAAKTLPTPCYLIAPEKSERGKNRYRFDMQRPFDEHVRAQGLEWVTIQTMRRTFASLLATTGKVSIEMIAGWLGDTIKTTEQSYAHLIPRHDLIEHAFDGARAPKKKRAKKKTKSTVHSGKSSSLSRATAASQSSKAKRTSRR